MAIDINAQLSILDLSREVIVMKLKWLALESILEDRDPVLHIKYAKEFNRLLNESEEFKIVKRSIHELESQL